MVQVAKHKLLTEDIRFSRAFHEVSTGTSRQVEYYLLRRIEKDASEYMTAYVSEQIFRQLHWDDSDIIFPQK